MLEKLRLDKPIAFIDVETTGLKPYSDRIVELSVLRVSPDGKQEYKNHRVNPGDTNSSRGNYNPRDYRC